MAVTLTCPTCGETFPPDPRRDGKFATCPSCGRDVKVPAAKKPVRAAAPPSEDDEPDERPARRRERRESRERRPEREPARGSLVWLWVLLGSALLGLAVGGVAVYLMGRDKPDEQPMPVAQKPDPPAEKPPVKPEPKPEPPKPEPPKPEPPRPDPPKVVPPKPVGAAAADRVPAIPGLKFHLACDAVADGKVTEGVSGKPVGTGVGLEVIDGKRGKALRLTHDRKDAHRHALDLSDARDTFAVGANQPFTLAFWARRWRADAAGGFGAYLLDAGTAPNDLRLCTLSVQLLPSSPALAAITLHSAANRGDRDTLKSAHPTNNVAEPMAWNHFALVRDERNRLRWLVNGADSPGAPPVHFPGELRFGTVGILRSSEAQTVIDLDDFCLFDRALTDGEFASLTGLKLAPRPPDLPVGKLPPAGAVAAAGDMKGLRFYLPCDKVEGGAVNESVGGKLVGKGKRVELVDGPRGKALRITAGGAGPREGLDLSEHGEALSVAEGKPFTMAVWVRTDNWDNIGGTFIDAHLKEPNRYQAFTLYRYTKGVGFLVQQGVPGGGGSPINQLARGSHEMPPTKAWIHLALSRDEKGTVRLAVDGKHVVTAEAPYTAELRFTQFALGWQQGGGFVADYDEFCLFDRVLTGEEIARLAGKNPDAAK